MEFDRHPTEQQNNYWRQIRMYMNGIAAPANGVLLGITGYMVLFGNVGVKSLMPDADPSQIRAIREIMIATSSFASGMGMGISAILESVKRARKTSN